MSLNFKDLNVASLDYSDIVSSMTAFLKQEPSLSDLDYDNKASAINMLVNILATATAYNGVYSQFGYKESFLSTATLLQSVVGLASNSSILLEVKKSAQSTRNISVSGTTLPAFTAFPATTINGANTNFFNIEEVAANTIATVTLYAGSEVVQYGAWDFNTQSITLPLTVDPETIKLYSADIDGVLTTWERVDKTTISSPSIGNYYTVLNTVNGYLVTANLPNSNTLTTDLTVYCKAIVSTGSAANSARINSNTYASFVTTESPSGGYEDISVDLARAKVQFAANSEKRCVTISDFETAILVSGISGTDNIDNITVQNANEPCVIKIYVDGLQSANQNLLITYLSEMSVAGINLIYSQ